MELGNDRILWNQRPVRERERRKVQKSKKAECGKYRKFRNHKEELPGKNWTTRNPEPHPLHTTMAKIMVDKYSDEQLVKLYVELHNKDTWDESCNMCKMPAMLHPGVCTRQNGDPPLEFVEIHEEVEKFRYRMKRIIKYVAEEREKKEKKEEQIGLVAGLKNLVEVMTNKENKSMKLVKVAKAPGKIKNMDLKTYKSIKGMDGTKQGCK